MSTEQIEQSVKRIEGLSNDMIRYTGGRIDQYTEALDYDIYILNDIVALEVVSVEMALVDPLAVMYLDAQYRVMRFHFQNQTSVIAILIAIWDVVKTVWEVIGYVLQVWNLMTTLGFDDWLADNWQWFDNARNVFRENLAKLSEAMGWGADGLAHLLHATQGFMDVYSGLTGKDRMWMHAEWMDKTGSVLTRIKNASREIAQDPGHWLEIMFQEQMFGSMDMTSEWAGEFFGKLEAGIEKGRIAFQGVSDITNEILAIQDGMPDFIRQHIPTEIWTRLEQFSTLVDEQILPRVRTIENTVSSITAIFYQEKVKISQLAYRIANPGSLLMGIDDLPDYMQPWQEGLVDDVASRTFGSETDATRAYLQPDLDKFDLIDGASTSPLPVLPFMNIESPGQAALHGIVAEPQETWFIDGYNDKH